MIQIKDVTLLDILPHTFDTDNDKALSAAIAALSTFLYTQLSSVLFWADIEHADAATLDAMAAELDAPFYSSDMSDTQKRSVIAAAFAYNSRIGTPSSVEALLTAAFGGGKISEWFEYGGNPFYFKIDVPRSGTRTELENLDFFLKNIDKFKNVRSKVEGMSITERAVTKTLYHGAAMSIRRHIDIPYRTYRGEG